MSQTNLVSSQMERKSEEENTGPFQNMQVNVTTHEADSQDGVDRVTIKLSGIKTDGEKVVDASGIVTKDESTSGVSNEGREVMEENPENLKREEKYEKQRKEDKISQGISEKLYRKLVENYRNTETKNIPWPIRVVDILPRSFHNVLVGRTSVNRFLIKLNIEIPEDKDDSSSPIKTTTILRDIKTFRCLGKALIYDLGLNCVIPLCPKFKYFEKEPEYAKAQQVELLNAILKYYTSYDSIKSSVPMMMFLCMKKENGKNLYDETILSPKQLKAINSNLSQTNIITELHRFYVGKNRKMRQMGKNSISSSGHKIFRSFVKARRGMAKMSEKVIKVGKMNDPTTIDDGTERNNPTQFNNNNNDDILLNDRDVEIQYRPQTNKESKTGHDTLSQESKIMTNDKHREIDTTDTDVSGLENDSFSLKMAQVDPEDELQKRYVESILNPYRKAIKEVISSIRDMVRIRLGECDAEEELAKSINSFAGLCNSIPSQQNAEVDEYSLTRLISLPDIDNTVLGLASGAYIQDSTSTRRCCAIIESLAEGTLIIVDQMLTGLMQIATYRANVLLSKYKADYDFFRANEKLEALTEAERGTPKGQKRIAKVVECEKKINESNAKIVKITRILVCTHRRCIEFVGERLQILSRELLRCNIQCCTDKLSHWDDVVHILGDIV